MLALTERKQAMPKQVLAIVAIGLVVMPDALAQETPAQKTVVRRGTALKVSTLQPLDSAAARPGDDVPLRLSRPLVVNGVTLLREGELLHGRVTQVQHAGPKCSNGQVRWKVEHIVLANADTVQTRLYTDVPWRHSVPDELPLGRESNFYQRFVSPALKAPIVALGLLVIWPAFILPDGSPPCKEPGKESLLPANSTLIVVITKDHHVRF
jgi:hypothetical protein